MKKQQRLVVRTIILLVLAAALGYTLYANFNKEEAEKIEKNKAVPNFSLVDLNGEKHKLSDYRGQGIVLNFWATYCGPCEREMPAINSKYHEFKDKGVAVLAVNMGESEVAVKKFVDRHKLDLPIMIDTEGDVGIAYRIGSLPATFFIDKDGKLVDTHVGELNEKMLQDYIKKIKP